MSDPNRLAEMRQHPQARPFTIDTRSERLQAGAPFSPASTSYSHSYANSPYTLSPASPRYPEKVRLSTSRDSFASKPSISDASHDSISPSVASSHSDQRLPQHTRHDSTQRSSGRKSGQHSKRYSQRGSRDVERVAIATAAAAGTIDVQHGPQSPHSVRSVRSVPGSRRTAGGPVVLSDANTTVVYNDGHDEWDERRLLESKALSILIYLSGPAVAVSFLFLFWALAATFLVLLQQPLRIFQTRPTFGAELTSLLSPALRVQLRLIRSSASSASYRPGCLLSAHLFSPFVSFGVAFASWIAACFWFFSAVLGDPAGKDGYNDGRSTVLGVRAWWERWLCRALA